MVAERDARPDVEARGVAVAGFVIVAVFLIVSVVFRSFVFSIFFEGLSKEGGGYAYDVHCVIWKRPRVRTCVTDSMVMFRMSVAGIE